ncbi:MAG: class D beta-lactamase [bacterium]|nr:class D beta-lactamase [bacterium]
MTRILIALCILAMPVMASAENETLSRLFARHGIEGTLVLSALNSGETFVHDKARARKRFPIASTFKIMNSLIALEEKVISGKDEVMKWDGRIHDFPDWNRDQTLESAFKVSCVWCYQSLARKVGGEKYREYLQKVGYGELREPFVTDAFWLDGSLQVSAFEQIEFLKQVHLRSLPFAQASYETLREIMVVEKTADYTIRAKTGWAARATPQVGWYVGYIETAKDVWFFALNIAMRGDADLPLRKVIVQDALRERAL